MYILAFTLLTLTFIPKMSGWKLNVSALFSDAVSLYYYLLYFLSFFLLFVAAVHHFSVPL